ncbi:MAG: hypothetical protein DBX47_05270 [Clostridiales bacterium]|nr:MAG: hypothetical protein DBX47_05270 [Clostridiales bacterium]
MIIKKITVIMLVSIFFLTLCSCSVRRDNGENPVHGYIYKRVILIGVDGAGSFFEQADTPNIDKIFADGATSYNVLTSKPTISAQCWGSMLIGASASVHGLTNDYIEENKYDINSNLPTVFKRIRNQYPEAKMASYCNWNPINTGIVERNIGVSLKSNYDEALTEDIILYLRRNDPKFLFVQFDSVDGSGHTNGYGSAQHLAQINTVDSYIGKIYDYLAEKNMLEDTLFLVTADHGGTPEGNHGGNTDAEKNIFFGARGKTIIDGKIGEMNVRDTVAVVLNALGIDIPQFNIYGFSSQLPENIFKDCVVRQRQSVSASPLEHETVPTPLENSGNYITDFLDSSKLETVLFFDGNANDAMNKTLTESYREPKYYNNGYYGSCIEVGKQGYISLPNLTVGTSSFSISLWFYLDNSVSSDPALYGNKDWDSGINEGFILSLRPSDIKFNIGNGSSRSDFEYALPETISEGWINTILVVDRENNTTTFYYNFNKVATRNLNNAFIDQTFDKLSFNIGEDGTGSYNTSDTFKIDDFIFYRDVLTDNDVSLLSNYYQG